MAVKLRIPTPLRAVAKGNADVQAKGDTIDDVLADLERQFPGMRERLLDDGDIPPYVDRVLAKPPKIRQLREVMAQLCGPKILAL